MKKKIFYQLSVVLLVLTAVAVNSCEMYEYQDPSDENDNGNKVATTIAGNVMDENNLEIAGATVTVEGTTTTTDNHGTFYFDNIKVSEKRCVIKITKSGYLKGFIGVIPHKENVTYVRLIMLESVPSNSINSSAGGTISLTNGGSIVLPANSYVYVSSGNPYSGMVSVVTKYLSPDDANFSFKTPGSDLLGKNAADETVALVSYGMLSVELKDNSGQLLQLAPNSNAVLSMPIATSQIATSPATIPLWHFDESTAVWKEEGQAVKTGNFYVGTVHHFTWWNCDAGFPPAYIQGKVVDCNGNPLANIVVSHGNGYYTTITDNDGNYSEIVRSNLSFTVQVLANNNSGAILNSQLVTVPAIVAQQTYTVPDLVVLCPSRIIGSILECGQPAAHALVFADWNGSSGFAYTINGNYSLPVPSSTTMVVSFYSLEGNSWAFVSTGTQGTTTTVPNTDLCSTNQNDAPTENSFILDGDNHHFELIDIDTVDANTGAAQWGNGYLISVNGYNKSNGESLFFNIYLTDTVPGIYPVSGSGVNLISNSYSMDGTFPIVHVKLRKWEHQHLGIVSGTFEGPAVSSSGDSSCFIYSGKFSVKKFY